MQKMKRIFVVKNTQTDAAPAFSDSNNSPVPSSIPTVQPPHPPLSEYDNIFLKSGPRKPHQMTHVGNMLYSKIDMPGCCKKDLKMWVDNEMVHFFADAKQDPVAGFKERKYGGSFVLNAKVYKVTEAKAEIKHGVFLLSVPKLTDSDSDSNSDSNE